VGQLADGETVHTLEGVTSDHNGVRVVCTSSKEPTLLFNPQQSFRAT
jgi:hypothetical protein